MRKSSAQQNEFDFSASELFENQQSTLADSVSDYSAVEASSSQPPLKIPTFGLSPELYAVTSRLAGRLNAASISPGEYEKLLSERQALLDKKLNGEISRKDAIRLDYVHWSLDRIEDARYGYELDALESSIGRYEQFLKDVQNLTNQLSGQKSGRRK